MSALKPVYTPYVSIHIVYTPYVSIHIVYTPYVSIHIVYTPYVSIQICGTHRCRTTLCGWAGSLLVSIHDRCCVSYPEGLIYQANIFVDFPVNHFGFLPVSSAVDSVGL